jgi:hypothetical protein
VHEGASRAGQPAHRHCGGGRTRCQVTTTYWVLTETVVLDPDWFRILLGPCIRIRTGHSDRDLDLPRQKWPTLTIAKKLIKPLFLTNKAPYKALAAKQLFIHRC